MDPCIEESRVTELHVRMDCTGCVNKIKRAVHRVEGVNEMLINFPEQKVIIIGRANPELVVKAIKKVRKTATICTPTSELANEDPPPPAAAAEECSDEPPPPAPELVEEGSPSKENPEAKELVEEHPMVHEYPHGYWSDKDWEKNERSFHGVTQSCNTYRSQAITQEYACGYGVAPSNYDDVGIRYHEGYYCGERGRNNGVKDNMDSMFSDENPNACIIV